MPRPDDRPVPDSLASRVPNPARGAVGRRAYVDRAGCRSSCRRARGAVSGVSPDAGRRPWREPRTATPARPPPPTAGRLIPGSVDDRPTIRPGRLTTAASRGHAAARRSPRRASCGPPLNRLMRPDSVRTGAGGFLPRTPWQGGSGSGSVGSSPNQESRSYCRSGNEAGARARRACRQSSDSDEGMADGSVEVPNGSACMGSFDRLRSGSSCAAPTERSPGARPRRREPRNGCRDAWHDQHRAAL